MIALVTFVFSGASGCSTSPETITQPEVPGLSGWGVLQDGSNYPDYPATEPSKVTAERIEYEAGQLLWARPGYRVVFHNKEEVATYPEDHPGYPDMYKDPRARLPPPQIVSNQFPSYLWFPAVARMHDEDVPWTPLPHPPTGEFNATGRQRQAYFGFYQDGRDGFFNSFSPTDSTPTLHLFECTKKLDEVRIFRFGDAWVSCNAVRGLDVFFPLYTEVHSKYTCFLRSMVSWMIRERHPVSEDFAKSIDDYECSDESGYDFDPVPNVEVAAWVGFEDPATRAHHHGYSFITVANGPPLIHSRNDPDHTVRNVRHEIFGLFYTHPAPADYRL